MKWRANKDWKGHWLYDDDHTYAVLFPDEYKFHHFVNKEPTTSELPEGLTLQEMMHIVEVVAKINGAT